MSEHSLPLRGRTFLAGKIISNFGQSSIDCIIRRISDDGATIEVASVFGVPEHFHLRIPNEDPPRPCLRKWQSEKQIGVAFETIEAGKTDKIEKTDKADKSDRTDMPVQAERRASEGIMRGQMLALRAALDEIAVGVVLLDHDLRSQFINRAFRRMWSLPDAVADRNPPFITLMYHGRDTNAYQIPADQLDAYVADRLQRVRDGVPTPIDLRRTNGEIVRLECAVLPDGGRMLSYTDVTDIVRHSDELERLRYALDNVSEGVVLLDADLNAQFMNKKMRTFWGVTDEQAASHPPYASLIANGPSARDRGMTQDELEAFLAGRVAAVRSASEPLRDLKTTDGRHIRAHCDITQNDGRMLTYCDVTDLVRNAEQLKRHATIDSMTGLFNRRHFLDQADAEWSRFQRYQRPLSMLMVDIDHFKQVNDRYGHAVGDETIVAVAGACAKGKRQSDIVGRLGGEEFAILLPETDLAQSTIVADRLCKAIAGHVMMAHKAEFKVTASIGIAAASVGMSGLDVLMRAADQALFQAKAQGRNCAVQWSPPEAPKLAAE
jgi:diguanylate cyclase (GGDEF)-like protein